MSNIYDEIFDAAVSGGNEPPEGENLARIPSLFSNPKEPSYPSDDIFKQLVSGAMSADIEAKNSVTPETSEDEAAQGQLEEYVPRVKTPKKYKRSVQKLNKLKPKKLSMEEESQAPAMKRTKSNNAVTSKKTTKDLILALQKKRIEDQDGTWVQCCNSRCAKWRYLDEIKEPFQVPDKWYCKMNKDLDHNSCEAPEEDSDTPEMVYNKFTAGSIVWAKMIGYPWWPAMVDDDPDILQFWYESDVMSGVVTHYHVVLLDNKVKRAWIPCAWVKPFTKEQVFPTIIGGKNYKREIKQAYKKAVLGLEMTLENKLKKFSFVNNYKGPWPSVPDDDDDEATEVIGDSKFIEEISEPKPSPKRSAKKQRKNFDSLENSKENLKSDVITAKNTKSAKKTDASMTRGNTSSKKTEKSVKTTEKSAENASTSAKNAEISTKKAATSMKNAEISTKKATTSMKNAEISTEKATTSDKNPKKAEKTSNKPKFSTKNTQNSSNKRKVSAKYVRKSVSSPSYGEFKKIESPMIQREIPASASYGEKENLERPIEIETPIKKNYLQPLSEKYPSPFAMTTPQNSQNSKNASLNVSSQSSQRILSGKNPSDETEKLGPIKTMKESSKIINSQEAAVTKSSSSASKNEKPLLETPIKKPYLQPLSEKYPSPFTTKSTPQNSQSSYARSLPQTPESSSQGLLKSRKLLLEAQKHMASSMTTLGMGDASRTAETPVQNKSTPHNSQDSNASSLPHTPKNSSPGLLKSRSLLLEAQKCMASSMTTLGMGDASRTAETPVQNKSTPQNSQDSNASSLPHTPKNSSPGLLKSRSLLLEAQKCMASSMTTLGMGDASRTAETPVQNKSTPQNSQDSNASSLPQTPKNSSQGLLKSRSLLLEAQKYMSSVSPSNSAQIPLKKGNPSKMADVDGQRNEAGIPSVKNTPKLSEKYLQPLSEKYPSPFAKTTLEIVKNNEPEVQASSSSQDDLSSLKTTLKKGLNSTKTVKERKVSKSTNPKRSSSSEKKATLEEGDKVVPVVQQHATKRFRKNIEPTENSEARSAAAKPVFRSKKMVEVVEKIIQKLEIDEEDAGNKTVTATATKKVLKPTFVPVFKPKQKKMSSQEDKKVD